MADPDEIVSDIDSLAAEAKSRLGHHLHDGLTFHREVTDEDSDWVLRCGCGTVLVAQDADRG